MYLRRPVVWRLRSLMPIVGGLEGDIPIDATLTLRFAIYPVATGGPSVWSEKQTIVFKDGYFTAELGSVTPFEDTTFDGTVGFLGVTVGQDVEMTPRTSIASVPYAFNGAAPNGLTYSICMAGVFPSRN